MKFNVDDYKGKYVMHCKTREEAEDFCRVLHEAGRKWCSGESYLNRTNWDVYLTLTHYNFNCGGYGMRSTYEGCTILEWEDFMNKDFTTKADLETGDIVTFQNGEKGIIFLNFEAIVGDNFDKYYNLPNFTSDLTNIWEEQWNIVKVQRPKYIHQIMKPRWDEAPVIWEREEVVEMTLAEVCKALGKNIKIVKE